MKKTPVTGKKTKTLNKKYETNGLQRKASTPTHDKPTRTESPDVSHIMPNEISPSDLDKEVCDQYPTSIQVSKTVTDSEKEFNIEDKIDFAYTRYLQTIFRRKLAEAEASKVDDNLTELQNKISENQKILQNTTERLKNINFNKEVEALHKLRNPDYGRVLETLSNANCKEYLESVNRKLEQSQNQLRMKNVELPEGGGTALLEVMKDTLAACEKLKANNNIQVPKVIEQIKMNNRNTSETLSRCLEMVPEVENLILDRAILEISAKYNNQ